MLQASREPPWTALRHRCDAAHSAARPAAAAPAWSRRLSPAPAGPGAAPAPRRWPRRDERVRRGQEQRFTKLVSAAAGRAGGGAAVPADAASRRAQKHALGARRPPAGGAPARHRQRIIPYTAEWNPRARHWQLGSQPARQQAAQRLLHAGRQDRLLLRHPGAAAAQRRRGGDDHGPRDGARAARARARAHGQDASPRAAASRSAAALLGLGSTGAHCWPTWAASC